MNYDEYNREERAACAHLFRLLHEQLASDSDASPLRKLADILGPRLRFSAGSPGLRVDGAAIFTEVALIRDAYKQRRAQPAPFMDALVALVKKQEGVDDARPWSELPSPLNDPKKTHPHRIAKKGRKARILTGSEQRVYGAVQGMFNAKPDLALVLPMCFIVFEAKLTQKFDKKQLERTHNIADVWSTLLFGDLGFTEPPPFAVAKLGDARAGVELSWQEISAVAAETYPATDRTRIALEHASKLFQ